MICNKSDGMSWLISWLILSVVVWLFSCSSTCCCDESLAWWYGRVGCFWWTMELTWCVDSECFLFSFEASGKSDLEGLNLQRKLWWLTLLLIFGQLSERCSSPRRAAQFMGCMEIFLNFPRQSAWNLSHDLAEKVVATGLNQAIGKHGDHPWKCDPDR